MAPERSLGKQRSDLVPSLLVKDKTIYAIQDAGFALTMDSETGKELWKSRVGGNFSASLSPGRRQYLCDQRGGRNRDLQGILETVSNW